MCEYLMESFLPENGRSAQLANGLIISPMTKQKHAPALFDPTVIFFPQNHRHIRHEPIYVLVPKPPQSLTCMHISFLPCASLRTPHDPHTCPIGWVSIWTVLLLRIYNRLLVSWNKLNGR